MPPKRSATGMRRQLSVETVATRSSEPLDSDGDGDEDDDFDPIQAAAELRRVIDGHKKRRLAARKKIEKTYAAQVAAIVAQAETRLAEREQALTRTRQDQLARLAAALERRDAAQRAAADQVGRFYDRCVTLTRVLQSVFVGLAEEAQRAVLEDGGGQTGQ